MIGKHINTLDIITTVAAKAGINYKMAFQNGPVGV